MDWHQLQSLELEDMPGRAEGNEPSRGACSTTRGIVRAGPGRVNPRSGLAGERENRWSWYGTALVRR